MLTSCDNILVTPHCRVINSFLQGTREGRAVLGVLGAASESHLFTKIIPSLSTNATRTARDAHFKSYTIANLKAVDLAADEGDNTRRLVAETELTFPTADVSISALLKVAYI